MRTSYRLVVNVSGNCRALALLRVALDDECGESCDVRVCDHTAPRRHASLRHTRTDASRKSSLGIRLRPAPIPQ